MLGLQRQKSARADTAMDTRAEARAESVGAELKALTGTMSGVLAAERLAFVNCDGEGRILSVGGNFNSISGLDPESRIKGRSVFNVLDELQLSNPEGSGPLDLSEIRRVTRALISAGTNRRLGTLALTGDSRTLSINTHYPGDGTFLATIRDVSSIASDRMMLDAAVRGAGAGYWSLDFNSGEYTYSESVLARLSRKERESIEKRGLFSIIDKEDLTRISTQWQDIVSGTAAFDLTYRVTTENDGLMWQRSIGRLLRRADGRLTKAVAFVMDITEDMKNRSDLEEAQGLAKAKEDFMARMSHEIRTPLNAIIGMADSLSDEPMSDEVREVLGEIETSAEALHALLSHTLDHAKMEAGDVRAEFEATEVRGLLGDCAKMWRAKAKGKGLDFRLAVGPDVPRMLPLDAFRLRQCLNNLVSNAVKFTDAGRVTLAARSVTRKGRPHTCFIVQDTGIGMDEATAQAVFNPYQQADGSISRRYGGTGLGLSICRQLADLMQGEVVVRSTPGEGSNFLLFLPHNPEAVRNAREAAAAGEPPAVIAEPPELPQAGTPAAGPAAQAAERQARTVARLPFEGLSVLCVEDNPINQKVVERLIGGRVAQLHFASHGREALSVLNTAHVDVVLMDIHMPVMDGIETTMEIRKSDAAYANVIIIALTADPDYQQARICRNIGMNDAIAKPVRREDILEAFNRTMGALGETHGQRVALA